jgi:hypothetical protein
MNFASRFRIVPTVHAANESCCQAFDSASAACDQDVRHDLQLSF